MKPDFAMLQAEALLAPGVDKQAWKKQQRMIRNRESAALSRKRKRDRIESLEEQVGKIKKKADPTDSKSTSQPAAILFSLSRTIRTACPIWKQRGTLPGVDPTHAQIRIVAYF